MLIKKIKAFRKRRRDNEKIVADTVFKTGWSDKQARDHLAKTKLKYNISNKTYKHENFCRLDEEGQAERIRKMQKKQEREERLELKNKEAKARLKKNMEDNIQHVMDETGWDREKIVKEIEAARKNAGSSYEQYAIFRMWELTPEEQREVFTKSQTNKLKAKYNKNPARMKIFSNKRLFCKNFEPFLGREWAYVGSVDAKNFRETTNFEEFKAKFEDKGKIIYKPNGASGGRGVEVFEVNSENIREVFDKLQENGLGVVESFVTQHPVIQSVSVKAVNTIRVVTIWTDDEADGIETGKMHFVYAGLRMARGGAIVDNLHSGGMIADIDLETGKLKTDAADHYYGIFKEHPDTGTTIKGLQIPFFPEIKEMLAKAGQNIEGYLGWDVAITEDGPIIIEVNTSPGPTILQTPYVHCQKGMRYLVDPYIQPRKDWARADAPIDVHIRRMYSGGIELNWGLPTLADGYEIFRAYEAFGKYELIKTIEGHDVDSYADDTFNHDLKKVYYKVRSFYTDEEGRRSVSEMTLPIEAEYFDFFILERDVTFMKAGASRTVAAYHGWGEIADAEWATDNAAVATVDDKGVVTAVAKGSCIISCKSNSFGSTRQTKVVVDRDAEKPIGKQDFRYVYGEASGMWNQTSDAKAESAVIMMAGNLFCGAAQMEKQYSVPQGCNFNDSFKYVRKLIAGSDFAIGNLASFTSASNPYVTEEAQIDFIDNINVSPRFLDGVKYGGFDAVTLSANTELANKEDMLAETMQQINRYKLIGASKDSDTRFFIASINGIKTGFVTYKEAVDIAKCREAGAEFIIAYMDWAQAGRIVTDEKETFARGIAEAGADYIVGTGAALTQKYEELITSDGRKVPCFYSLGNLITSKKDVKGCRSSVVARIELQKDEKGEVVLADSKYIPFNCYTNCDGNCWAAVPMNSGIKAIKKTKKSVVKRLSDALGKNIKSV